MRTVLVTALPIAVVFVLLLIFIPIQRRRRADLPSKNALVGLSTPQRVEVVRAVRDGRRVDDPTLANRAFAWSAYVAASTEQALGWQRVTRWVSLVAGALLAVSGCVQIAKGVGVLVVVQIAFGVLIAVSGLSTGPRYRRAIARARTARELNRGPSSSDGAVEFQGQQPEA
jgi:hypothetical protein